MYNRKRPGGLGGMIFGATGWLFADLLLALALIFLLANTTGVLVPGNPGPTPGPTCVPMATPLPVLDLTPKTFEITIDPADILAGKTTAIDAAKSKVRAQKTLQGVRAGLVLSFGGALGGSTTHAEAIARAFDQKVLTSLGKSQYVFYPAENVLYREFHDLSNPPTKMEVNVYVFENAAVATPTASANASCTPS